MDTTEALKRLLVALLVGLLIGLDRERAELRKGRRLFAGVRTFPLIALLGGALSMLLGMAGPWPLVTGLVAVSAIALVSYRQNAAQGEIGATTEIAALATYAVGATAGVGPLAVAAAMGVAIAVLLVAKPRLEGISRALSEQEIIAVLEIAVITAIVMPLLPDRGLGPWDVLNPFRIWLVVVLVSLVSFAGFMAVRWKGERAGLFWAGGLGALVSSTATTVSMAQRSREASLEQQRLLAAATVLASTVTCGRIAVLVAAMGPSLLPPLAVSLGAAVVVGMLATLILGRGSRASGTSAPTGARSIQNPMSLRGALGFGALYACISLLVRASEARFGGGGKLVAAAISGFVDVDAISVALARGVRAGLIAEAHAGIIIAYCSNNLFKSGAAIAMGAGRFRRDVAVSLCAMAIAAGLATCLFQQIR
jgi:uncharacterized membrane protein (DUF4010 family)